MIGVISDTHGLLRPEAIEALRGSELILHAGDIGDIAVIEALKKVAPVCAVRGNVDTSPWAQAFPATQFYEYSAHSLYMLHNIRELDIDPAAAGACVAVYGHSHKPLIEHKENLLYLNPGSAGPRRFSLPVSVARLWFEAGRPVAEIVELPVS